MTKPTPPQPAPSAEVIATAIALKDEMGHTALDAASAALEAAKRMGSVKLIDLWAGVRAVLVADLPAQDQWS